MLLQGMDNSLVRGHIYQISYTLRERRTDAFYQHRREQIQHIQDILDQSSDKWIKSAQDRINGTKIQQVFKRELSYLRETSYLTDFSVDGVGFYLKQSGTSIDASGKEGPLPDAIYASDGKVMGAFYPHDMQAALLPATERPPGGGEYWADIAYFFMRQPLTSWVEKMPNLKVKQDGEDLVVVGDQPGEEKEWGHLELRVDKAKLLPKNFLMTYNSPDGVMTSKWTKTWEFQNCSGLLVPKTVIEQEYKANISGKMELEREVDFNVTSYSVQPKNCKEAFATLLHTNYSVFDQISGTRYLSGNPGDALDRLSK